MSILLNNMQQKRLEWQKMLSIAQIDLCVVKYCIFSKIHQWDNFSPEIY